MTWTTTLLPYIKPCNKKSFSPNFFWELKRQFFYYCCVKENWARNQTLRHKICDTHYPETHKQGWSEKKNLISPNQRSRRNWPKLHWWWTRIGKAYPLGTAIKTLLIDFQRQIATSRRRKKKIITQRRDETFNYFLQAVMNSIVKSWV